MRLCLPVSIFQPPEFPVPVIRFALNPDCFRETDALWRKKKALLLIALETAGKIKRPQEGAGRTSLSEAKRTTIKSFSFLRSERASPREPRISLRRRTRRILADHGRAAHEGGDFFSARFMRNRESSRGFSSKTLPGNRGFRRPSQHNTARRDFPPGGYCCQPAVVTSGRSC